MWLDCVWGVQFSLSCHQHRHKDRGRHQWYPLPRYWRVFLSLSLTHILSLSPSLYLMVSQQRTSNQRVKSWYQRDRQDEDLELPLLSPCAVDLTGNRTSRCIALCTASSLKDSAGQGRAAVSHHIPSPPLVRDGDQNQYQNQHQYQCQNSLD